MVVSRKTGDRHGLFRPRVGVYPAAFRGGPDDKWDVFVQGLGPVPHRHELLASSISEGMQIGDKLAAEIGYPAEEPAWNE